MAHISWHECKDCNLPKVFVRTPDMLQCLIAIAYSDVYKVSTVNDVNDWVLAKLSKANWFSFLPETKRKRIQFKKTHTQLEINKKTVLKIGLHVISISNTVVCQKTLFDLLWYDMSELSADFNLLYNSIQLLQILENLAMKSIASTQFDSIKNNFMWYLEM